MINPFAALGVSPRATKEEIRKAYMVLAKTLHPDVNPDPAATERLKVVNQAWDMLKTVHSPSPPPPPRDSFDEFVSRTWETKFNHNTGAYDWQTYTPQRHNITVQANIDLAAAYKGVNLTIPYGDRFFSVKCPAGVADGMKLRVSEGDTDLLVTIRIHDHPNFERRGQDLFASVYMSALDAILGEPTTFTHLDGSVLTIKPSPNGADIVLEGRGMPSIGHRGAGNLTIVPIYTLPNLSDEQREAIRSIVKT